MNDNVFDKKIKTALDNLSAPYDAASWAMLEQRLNAPFAEEQPAPVDAVDTAVFRTLDRLEAPFQPAHWDMLANRMTQAARHRRRVWISKLSEAAIFLLLLVNLDGFLGTGTSSPQEPEVPLAPPSNRLQAGIPNNKTQRDGSAQPGSATHSVVLGNVENGINAPAYLTQGIDIQSFKATNASGKENYAAADPSTPLSDSGPDQWLPLAGMAALPFSPGAGVERVNASPYRHSTVQVKAPKQHRFYAATYANFDQNNIQSEGYSTTSKGYGGGMAIGYRIGKWGVEAGLSYNRRHYQPKKVIEIYDGNTTNGFYGSFANNVDADVVSFPVKITRRIAQFGQTSAHATAGVTTNIAVDKSFQYGSVFYPGPAPNGNQSPDQQPKLRQNGQGVFESGSFHGNVYASADLGVRLEHPIGRHFAAFVEPVYHQALGKKGIGPNPAKVNTLSVKAGVLATL